MPPGKPASRGVAPISIWYSWTAPATGQVQFDTRGSHFDTVLAVHRGATLAVLRQVAFNDDFRGLTSRVRFTARAGRTYRIAVTSYSRGDTGRAVLTWLGL